MNITVQKRDDNIEAIISNEYKLLVISMNGLSLLTSLVNDNAKFLEINKERKRRFIDKYLAKLYIKLFYNK